MKPKTSCRFDGISTKLLKFIKQYILAEPLTIVANQMLNTGIFPDLLKITNALPVYKKDDETITDQFLCSQQFPKYLKK